MTTTTRTTGARIVLSAAVVLLVTLALVPGSTDALRSDAGRAVGAASSLGHGTLAVDPRFAVAMAVTAVTAPLPVLLAEAGRASRLVRGVRQRAVVSGGVVLALAAAVSVHAADGLGRFRDVVVAGLVGVALGTLLDAALGARRRAWRASVRSRRVAWIAAAVHAVVVLVGTASSPVDGGIDPWLIRVLAVGQRLGAPAWLGYSAIEFTANVCFFVPLGLLAVLLLGARRWWVGVLGGFVVSVGIETVQALFLPARYASVDDVTANTSGAVVGVLIGMVVLGRARRGG